MVPSVLPTIGPSTSPAHNYLMHRVNLAIGVAHRNKVQVVEVVFSSVAWGLICLTWGATVSRIVCNNLDLQLLLQFLHPTSKILALGPLLRKRTPLPHVDLLVSACTSTAELTKLEQVLSLCNARIVLISLPHGLTRTSVLESLNFDSLKTRYSIRLSSISHERVGGATSSRWRAAVLVAHSEGWVPPSLTWPNLPTSRIINMIDDKIGGGYKSPPPRAWHTLRDSSEIGWDLGLNPNKIDYWVKCPSVFSHNLPIVRPIALHELCALWDFQLPGDDELPVVMRKKLLMSFLHGPPGKIIRKFSYAPLHFLWKRLETHTREDISTSRNIDYSLIAVEDMGVKATHLKATKADDAPVDFELWAWPNESELETFARNLLRLACFTFWKLNLVREAFRWLNFSPDSIPSERSINQLAIIDCITRSSNSTFWDWEDNLVPSTP